MADLRWVDKTQPQTLMMATIIMYINAALGVFDGEAFAFPLGTLLALGPVAAGLGIANEKKWGYWLGVGLAVLQLLFIIVFFRAVDIINLLFYGALVALLLHPQSRNYRRTWFR